jgi:Ca2+-binding EF-hand superfamily protein
MHMHAAEYRTKEQQYREAFRYYDKDGDGIISPVQLAQILQSLGKCQTREEMDRLLFCLDPDAITEQDFLNVMASQLIKGGLLSSPKIIDAFKLYNAAKHNKSSNTDGGTLRVNDGGRIMREDWAKFATEFIQPLNVKTKARFDMDTHTARDVGKYDLAFFPPYVFVDVKRDASDCFEGHRVQYRDWVRENITEHSESRFPTHSSEILNAFRLFNHVYRGKRAHTADDKLYVDDDGMILREDLLRIVTTMGVPLNNREQAAFFEKAEEYGDGDYIDYEKLVQAFYV